MKKFFVSMMIAVSGLVAWAELPPTVVEQWGGDGIEVLLLDDGSARIEFDCAAGWVKPGVWPQTKTKLNVKGVVVRHTGVRPPPGWRPPQLPAVFKASINRTKGEMTFSSKSGKNPTERYTLKLNQEPNLRRCM